MTKEFLLECERKLAKSYVCTALGRDDDSIAITKEIAKDIAFEVTNSIHPISMETAPYVVAALRTLANGIEKEMNPLDKEIARALQELMGRFQFVKEEVKVEAVEIFNQIPGQMNVDDVINQEEDETPKAFDPDTGEIYEPSNKVIDLRKAKQA